MELTHTHAPKGTLTSLRNEMYSALTSFIHKHGDVFEAMTRAGSPFGNGRLPVNSYLTDDDEGGTESIEALKTKIDMLAISLADAQAQLAALSRESPAKKASSGRRRNANEIGINRFRALRA